MDSESRSTASLSCAECGAALPPEVKVCERCSPPAEGTIRQERSIRTMLRRLRGQILVGVVWLPWLLGPLAFQNALRASDELERSGNTDAALWSEVRRLRTAAIALTLVTYGLTFLVLWELHARR